MNEIVYWIWLSMAVEAGNSSFAKLYAKHPDIKEIYDLDEYELRKILGSRSSDISKLKNKDLTKANEVYEFCVRKEVGILIYSDDKFPKLLIALCTSARNSCMFSSFVIFFISCVEPCLISL